MKKITLCALLVLPAFAQAEDCSLYPFARGTDVIPVEGSAMPKILSTARAAPFSDDIDDVEDAVDEATLEAKAQISRFMGEMVSSEETRQKLTAKLAEQSGDSVEKTRQSLEVVTRTVSSNSQALLRGVVILGECYTPGREVRVTVGLKPETLEQAAGMSSAIDATVPKPVDEGSVAKPSPKESSAVRDF